MEKFNLQSGEDYIQLNDLMKVLNWVASGGEAKQHILEEQVLVNGNVEMRIRRKLKAGDTVSFGSNEAEIDSSITPTN
ncbi:MAG: RNA-binding S4 domain-containing protein [Marinoscillum sp.]